MKFSIVTPSFRNSQWLKLCVASVADQQGVEVEHLVQDAGSDDGTLDWLTSDPRVRAFVEKDAGMYDAVNRGFRKSSGDVLAYLNCDEQYLPGALAAVADFFQKNPNVDVAVADTVIVDTKGDYICHRYALTPLRHHLWVRFNVITCALFIRRRVVEEMGLFFDTQWRDLGDVFWLIEATRRGVRFGALRYFTSAFTETGENMNLKPNALREKKVKRAMTPALVKICEPLIVAIHRARTLASGAYFQKPFDYEIYTLDSPRLRARKHAAHPTARWRARE